MFLLDIPVDYTKLEVKESFSNSTAVIIRKSRNVSLYSFSKFENEYNKYSSSSQTLTKKRKPTDEALKKAMFRKSSKAIGRILSRG